MASNATPSNAVPDSINAIKASAFATGAPNVGPYGVSKDPYDTSPVGSGGPTTGPHFYGSDPSNNFDSLAKLQSMGGTDPFTRYIISPLVKGTADVSNSFLNEFVNGPLNVVAHPSAYLKQWEQYLFGGGGGSPSVDLSGDVNTVANSLKGGKKGAKGAAPGTPQLTPFQQQLQALVDNLNSQSKKGFNVPYQQVQPNYVKPNYVQASTVPLPFGKQGYQPPAKLENSLLGDIAARTGNNFLGAFLPAAIREAAQIYGPQVAAQLLQSQNNANTISGYNTGANELLSQIPGQVKQNFDNSIALQGAIDQGIRGGLNGLNPGNANLLSPDAPLSQTDQIQNQEDTSFKGAGQVLGGLGDLNASSLAAQRASAVSAADQLPFLNTISGRQALVANLIGNQSAMAKLQVAEANAADKIANENLGANSRTINSETGLYRTLTGNDAKYIAQQLGIEKFNAGQVNSASKTNAGIANSVNEHNASEATRVALGNASNALSAVRASISAQNAAINQGRYALALAKAAYPQQSAAQQASLGKAAQSFFTGAVDGKLTTVHANGTTTTERTGTLTWDQAVRRWATTHGGDAGQASAFASGFYNYGQGAVQNGSGQWVGGRPLDPGMTQALQKAGLHPDFFYTKGGDPFLTTDQMAALGKAGYQSFVGSVFQGQTPQAISVDDAIKEGIISSKQASNYPNGSVGLWVISPYGK